MISDDSICKMTHVNKKADSETVRIKGSRRSAGILLIEPCPYLRSPRTAIYLGSPINKMGTDLTRHLRSEIATLPEVDESGSSTSFGCQPNMRGVSEPEISEPQSEEMSSRQPENSTGPIPITYPPPPLSVDPPRIEDAKSQAEKFRRKGRIHFAALCWSLFLEGWNDGSPGPLLPAIQKAYHVLFFQDARWCLSQDDIKFQVGFVVVSLFFVLSCVVILIKPDYCPPV